MPSTAKLPLRKKYYNWRLYKFCDICLSINADGVIRVYQSLQRRLAAQQRCSTFRTRNKYPRCTACAGNKNLSSASCYRNWILRFLDTQYCRDKCGVWFWNDNSFWFSINANGFCLCFCLDRAMQREFQNILLCGKDGRISRQIRGASFFVRANDNRRTLNENVLTVTSL